MSRVFDHQLQSIFPDEGQGLLDVVYTANIHIF